MLIDLYFPSWKIEISSMLVHQLFLDYPLFRHKNTAITKNAKILIVKWQVSFTPFVPEMEAAELHSAMHNARP